MLPYYSASQNQYVGTIFGCRTAYNNRAYQLTSYNKSTAGHGHFLCSLNWGYSDSRVPICYFPTKTICTVSKQGSIFYNAIGEAIDLTSSSFTTQNTILVFCDNEYISNAWKPNEFADFRLYSLRFSNSTNGLLRDFIPVRVGSTGYLYDNVTQTLFGSENDGQFILGPDIRTY